MFNQKKLELWIDDVEEWYYQIDKKVEKLMYHLYDRVSGIYFGWMGLLTYALSTFIAVILYLAADPSYSIFTHWISHLGDGPGGANIAFNLGWILTSGIIFFFLTNEIRILRDKRVNERILDIMSLATLSFSMGFLLVGLFPLHLTVAHSIAAGFYFYGGFTYFLLYGVILLKIPESGKIRSIFAFITIACHFLYFFSPLITLYTANTRISMFFLEWTVLLSEVSLIFVMILNYYITKFKERKMNKFLENVKNWDRNEWVYKNELVEYLDSYYN
jgi:hypothetical membrane protein